MYKEMSFRLLNSEIGNDLRKLVNLLNRGIKFSSP